MMKYLFLLNTFSQNSQASSMLQRVQEKLQNFKNILLNQFTQISQLTSMSQRMEERSQKVKKIIEKANNINKKSQQEI